MFLAACEGYFDKMNEVSALMRIQTLILAQAAGAKKKGGGDLMLTDLWSLTGERPAETKQFVWGDLEDALKLKAQIEAKHNIKLA